MIDAKWPGHARSASERPTHFVDEMSIISDGWHLGEAVLSAC